MDIKIIKLTLPDPPEITIQYKTLLAITLNIFHFY